MDPQKANIKRKVTKYKVILVNNQKESQFLIELLF